MTNSKTCFPPLKKAPLLHDGPWTCDCDIIDETCLWHDGYNAGKGKGAFTGAVLTVITGACLWLGYLHFFA